MVRIFGILGRARVGKDTTCDYLVEKLPNSIKLWHSYPIKKEAVDKLGITIEELDKYKNDNVRYAGVNVRKLLQEIADVHRATDPLYYVKLMENSITQAIIDGYENIIISDVRFQAELDNLYRIGSEFVLSIKVTRDISIADDNHNSETEVDGIRADRNIINDGSIDELKEKINKILYR